MKTGDYTLQGCSKPRGGIVVERKSYPDLLGCVQDGGRLEEQLCRLAEWDFPLVVVEGNLRSCVGRRYSNYGWTDYTLGARIARLTAKFQVPIFFVGNRHQGVNATIEFMYAAYKQKVEELNAS